MGRTGACKLAHISGSNSRANTSSHGPPVRASAKTAVESKRNALSENEGCVDLTRVGQPKPPRATVRKGQFAGVAEACYNFNTIERTSVREPVNLKMPAAHLKLWQTTVSVVLNDSPLGKSIPQETRKRVQAAAQQLNYRPNFFAKSLRQSRSMSVGVLAPDLTEVYFSRVMSGVMEELTRAHYFIRPLSAD